MLLFLGFLFLCLSSDLLFLILKVLLHVVFLICYVYHFLLSISFEQKVFKFLFFRFLILNSLFFLNMNPFIFLLQTIYYFFLLLVSIILLILSILLKISLLFFSFKLNLNLLSHLNLTFSHFQEQLFLE